jgi:hypothetical protein
VHHQPANILVGYFFKSAEFMPLLSFELLKSHNWVFSFASFVDYIEKKKFVFLCFFPFGDFVFITTKMVGSELLTSLVPYIDHKTTVQICQMRSF